MKIESNRPVRTAVSRRTKGSQQGEAFIPGMAAEVAASPIGAPALVTGLDALFSLQEVPDATAERRQALTRGNQLLDRLDDLKLGLLTGSMSRADLSDLARLARSQSVTVSDPDLRDLLGHIELRAAVELAKLSQRDTA
jgi:hypothetical protein